MSWSAKAISDKQLVAILEKHYGCRSVIIKSIKVHDPENIKAIRDETKIECFGGKLLINMEVDE